MLATLTVQTETLPVPACLQTKAGFACTALAHCPPWAPQEGTGVGQMRCAGGAPGSSPSLCQNLPCQAGFRGLWLEESVAISREDVCLRGGDGSKWSPKSTSDLRAALQGPMLKDTNSAPAPIQYLLAPRSALSSSPSLPAAIKSPFSYEFGSLLAPTQADRVPACHPFPQPHSAWPGHLSQLDHSTLPYAPTWGMDLM